MGLLSSLHTEFDKFRLGQIFFISGVTWGLFFGDGLRKALFIAALLCLTKSQIKGKFYDSWTPGQKRAGKFLLAFCMWAFFIPLFFGVDSFLGKLRGTARPLELFIIMWETLIFAKDVFFYRTLKKFAITVCAVYSVLALGQRCSLGFAVNFHNWIITGNAWRVGTLLSGLVPWVIYAYLTEPSRRKAAVYAICAVLTWATMFLSLYSTFWLVIIVQATVLLLLSVVLFRKKFKRACYLIILFVALGMCAICSMTLLHSDMRGITQQWQQITALYTEHDFNKFTNRRDELWKKALVMIARRPLLGYGWVDMGIVGKSIGFAHPHNALLHAACNVGLPGAAMYAGLLVILAGASIKALKKNKNQHIPGIAFVVLLSFSAYFVCGALDDMFRSQRTIMTLYLSTFMLMLTPLARYVPDVEKNNP